MGKEIITSEIREKIKKDVLDLFKKIRAEVNEYLMNLWLNGGTISLKSFEQWQGICEKLPEYKRFDEYMQHFMNFPQKYNLLIKRNLSLMLDIYLMSLFLYSAKKISGIFSKNSLSCESEKSFSECFEVFEKIYVSTPDIVKHYLCYFLEGFKYDEMPQKPEDDGIEIKFDERLKIKKSREVVERFKEKYLLNRRHSLRTDYILETSCEYPFLSLYSDKDFQRILPTLRLRFSGKGDIGYKNFATIKLVLSTVDGSINKHDLFRHIKDNLENICYPYNIVSFSYNTSNYLGIYELKKEDEDGLKELHEKLKKLPPFLKIPLEFFNSGYEKHYDDMFIYYIIALDSLFFDKDERSSSYILSLRTALFLGKNEKERRKIFELVKQAYKLRNDIIHEGKFNGKIIDIVLEIEKVLRRSIKKALEYKEKKYLLKHIKDKIDNKIFSDDKN